MSIGKKILALFILLGLIILIVYGLFLMGGPVLNNGGGDQGEGGGLASPGARTIITLSIWGGSAFITGFGLRDVIGRVMATRQRNRMKAMTPAGTTH